MFIKTIFEERYAAYSGETPEGMVRRVARFLAEDPEQEEQFFNLMWSGRFLPNTPTLANAGKADPLSLSACYVLPVDDSMEDIGKAITDAMLIHKSGGGTGFSAARLRPMGDIVHSTGKISSGPLSFFRIIDTATDSIKQGGMRRGANLLSMPVDHPDIVYFVAAKLRGDFQNFNFSVLVTDEFFDLVREGKEIPLINPRTKKQWVAVEDVPHPFNGELLLHKGELASIDARCLLTMIATAAYRCGDPGLLFVDRANRGPRINDLSYETTNPCGEVWLHPYESCNLGSINLAAYHTNTIPGFDYASFKKDVRLAVRFLDRVIDKNIHPTPETQRASEYTRRIGLGVMGFHTLLVMLKIPYASQEALALARTIAQVLHFEAFQASVELAQEKGPFPGWSSSSYDVEDAPVRNIAVVSIAPTGTLSLLVGLMGERKFPNGVSGGIEPYFSIATTRRQAGKVVSLVEPLFLAQGVSEGWLTPAITSALEEGQPIQSLVPRDVAKLWETALDISSEWHLKHQAVWQNSTDNSVSKTINVPNAATIEDVQEAYTLAYTLRLKGVTVYRDGSKSNQVLSTSPALEPKPAPASVPVTRPTVNGPLTAVSVPIRTPQGNMRVHVTYDHEKPFEVFINLGKSGGDIQGMVEAIGRLLSVALRSGVDIGVLADQLIGIGGRSAVGFGEKRVLSVPDGIGKVLRLFTEEPHTPNATRDVCPECGNVSLVNQEGCILCTVCGHTAC